MAEHTPGPWEVKHETNVMAGERSIASCGGYSSSSDWDGKIPAENAANARLIAAAPALLAACEAFDAAERLTDTGAYLRALDALKEQMRAAIAKAREA